MYLSYLSDEGNHGTDKGKSYYRLSWAGVNAVLSAG